jgi:hypothetical protein
MSNHCRQTYYCYSSYLKSRGCDKEICNLVTAIENGEINVGPIIPGNCPDNPTTINNSVIINGCPSGPNSTTGILKVTGGNIGHTNFDTSSTITSFLNDSKNFGIQSSTGIRNLGPIYSSTDCNHTNYFGAGNHIFAGGSNGDCSANVLIRGNLLVDGSTVEIGGFIGETLTLITYPGNTDLGTLNLFRSPQADGNTMTVYNDTSGNILSGTWQSGLTFSIDGNLAQSTPGTGIDRIAGMTDTQGHVRSFRGITVSNPPIAGQPIDISYNRDISGSSYALQVYGDLILNPGNNNASGNIDLSGGDINFYLNNNLNTYIHSNGNASFNGHVTIYDLSVINLMTVGTSTTYINSNDVSTNNLNTNNVNAGFVIVDNSLNTSFIYSPFLQDLTIQAGITGNSNVEFVANKVIIGDLSVNDIYANSINLNVAILNNIITNNLTVSNHASIYDLSVNNILDVDNVTISGNQVESRILKSKNIEDLTIQAGLLGGQDVIFNANTINMENTSLVKITDLSVNEIISSHIDVNNLDVDSISSLSINNTNNITTTDLSVNGFASIYDLSVINLMTVGTSTTTIDTNSINSKKGIFNTSLDVNGTSTFNNSLILQKLGNTNFIQTPYGNINDNLYMYTEGTFNLDVSQNMVINGNEQIDITSGGYTEITAGQGIDLSANQDITFWATNVSFNNVSNVDFGNSVVDISDLRISYRLITSNIVSPNEELQMSSIQNGMTFTSLSGDISFTSSNSGFLVDANQGITFQANTSSVDFYGSQSNFVDMSVNMLDLLVNNITTNSINTNNSTNIISFGNSRLHDISSIIVENTVITHSVLSSSSNLTVGAVNGNLNLDSLGGNIYINAGNNDISFNADTITFDGNVCFLKNPLIKEADYDNRQLKIYGSSTTIISLDTSGVNLGPTNTLDISFNNILYSDLQPESLQNSIFNVINNYIDFSNNQLAVSDLIFSVSLSMTMTFEQQTTGITIQFEEINSRYPTIELDTRSISRKSNPHSLCFGPQLFVFSPTSPDNSLKGGIWKVTLVQEGSNGVLNNDARLTIKLKSIL